jgi:hypothetical protein
MGLLYLYLLLLLTFFWLVTRIPLGGLLFLAVTLHQLWQTAYKEVDIIINQL